MKMGLAFRWPRRTAALRRGQNPAVRMVSDPVSVLCSQPARLSVTDSLPSVRSSLKGLFSTLRFKRAQDAPPPPRPPCSRLQGLAQASAPGPFFSYRKLLPLVSERVCHQCLRDVSVAPCPSARGVESAWRCGPRVCPRALGHRRPAPTAAFSPPRGPTPGITAASKSEIGGYDPLN